jgi:DNA-binding transcriptional LysR family regulator
MDIDLHALRIFSQVMESKTFSGAARTLGITQPTVSQQIAKLEAEVGRLFQRVGHALVPTPLAAELRAFSTQVLDQASEFERRLAQQKNSLRGLVRYAMPESCQWTPHYKSIMRSLSALPELRFQIHILPNDETMKGLLEGHLDFGFICGQRLSPELRFQRFSEERYVAVAANARSLTAIDGDEPLRLITYPGWEQFFQTWAKHHGLSDRFGQRLPAPVVEIGTLAGDAKGSQKQRAEKARLPIPSISLDAWAISCPDVSRRSLKH